MKLITFKNHYENENYTYSHKYVLGALYTSDFKFRGFYFLRNTRLKDSNFIERKVHRVDFSSQLAVGLQKEEK